jgi:hypothetical protein
VPDAADGFDLGWSVFVVIIAFCDPLTIVLAAIGGWLSRRWWQLLLIPLAVLSAHWVLAAREDLTRYLLRPSVILPIAIASFLWALLVMLARRAAQSRDRL